MGGGKRILSGQGVLCRDPLEVWKSWSDVCHRECYVLTTSVCFGIENPSRDFSHTSSLGFISSGSDSSCSTTHRTLSFVIDFCVMFSHKTCA